MAPGRNVDSLRKLPAWARSRRPLPPGVRAALNQEIGIPLRTSPDMIRGPREIDITYSYSPDPGCERDERVTAAIRRFDPDLVPLWGRYTFVIDNLSGTKEMVTFGRHVIARRVPSPKNPLEPLKVVCTADYNGPVPNLIELIWDTRVFGQHDPRGKELPGEYLPWNWRMYKFAQEAWNFKQNNTVKQLKEKLVWKPQEVLAKAREARRKKQIELNAQLRKDAQKLLDKLSEVEVKQHMLYGHMKPRSTKVYSKMPSLDSKGLAFGGDLGKLIDTLPANAEIVLSS